MFIINIFKDTDNIVDFDSIISDTFQGQEGQV